MGRVVAIKREREEKEEDRQCCAVPNSLPFSLSSPLSGCTEFHSGSKRILSPPPSFCAGGKRRTFVRKKEEKMGETEVGEEDPAANPFSSSSSAEGGFPARQ